MQSMRLRRGEALRIGALTGATVLYVAVEGGFDIAPVLGSVSTDIRGGIGGWQGRALAAGDRLPLRLAQAGDRGEVCLEGFAVRPRPRVRVIRPPGRSLLGPRGRGLPRQRIHRRSERRPHGDAPHRPRPPAQPRLRHRVRWHRAGLDPGARQRPADRAAGGPPDHRRLSQDRDGDFGRPAGARAAAGRRQGRVRGGHRRGRRGRAACARRRACGDAGPDRAASPQRRRHRRRACRNAISSAASSTRRPPDEHDPHATMHRL